MKDYFCAYVRMQITILKTGCRIYPFHDNEKCNMVLGTDSLASNHQLSILEEMKIIKQNFPFIPRSRMLFGLLQTVQRHCLLTKNWAIFQEAKNRESYLIENIRRGRDHGAVHAGEYFESVGVWYCGSQVYSASILPYSHTFLLSLTFQDRSQNRQRFERCKTGNMNGIKIFISIHEHSSFFFIQW